jgi:ADP-ribose pyrophosphatase YjhB (NUDIX family)
MGTRQYPDRPILGVGALIFRDDCILLVRRGNEPLKGYWSLPGGVVEVGETLEQAIRREVKEETALDIDVVRVLEIFERIMRDAAGRPEYHYVLIDYLCLACDGVSQPASDAAEIAWVKEADLPGYTPLTEGTLPVIQKGFATIAKIEK